MKAKEQVYDDVRAEQREQVEKWGIQTHDPGTWTLILLEEVGEIAKALLEEGEEEYYKEMVHVAAVALSAMESYRRGDGKQ